MTVTIMRSHYPKSTPNIVHYRNYSKFNNDYFRNDLKATLEKLENLDYQSFENIFGSTLNKYAPVKQKYIRSNNSPFMTKTLCQNISHRSKLHNKYLSNPTLENKIAYKKQRNKCVQLLRMEKRKYYNNLDLKCLKDNRTFWRAVKPLFSEKCATSNKIILVESNKILNDENLVSDTINTYFTNVTKSLGIEDNYLSPCYLDDDTTPITKIINTYSNHPSIIKIKLNTKIKETFSLNAALEKDIKDIIDGIVPFKGISSTIPPKLLKMNNIYNNTLIHTSYPFDLKKGKITPVQRKMKLQIKKIIDLPLSSPQSLKFLRKSYIPKFMPILIENYQLIYVDFVKGMAPNMRYYHFWKNLKSHSIIVDHVVHCSPTYQKLSIV